MRKQVLIHSTASNHATYGEDDSAAQYHPEQASGFSPRRVERVIIGTAFLFFIGLSAEVSAADIEAVLNDAAGANALSVKDSGSVEQARIDSDGNTVIKGGMRLDASGVKCATAETLIVDGNVGIGTTGPLTILQIGPTNAGQDGYEGVVLQSTANDATGARWQGIRGDSWRTSGTGIGVDGTAAGVGAATNIGLYGWATGATINWGLYVAAGNAYVAGNVGIGTTAPGALLDLGTAGTTAGVLRLAGVTSGNVSVGTAAAAGAWTLTLPTSGGTSGYLLSTNGLGITSWVTPGSIGASWSSLTAPSANLGLTMAGYTTTLTYNNATGAGTNLFNLTDTLNNSGTGYLMDLTTVTGSALKPLHISAAGTEALTILANGNVGIGSTAPVQKLHVEGQCVTGDTKLSIFEQEFKVQGSKFKEIAIKDAKPGMMVYSLNEEVGIVEPHRITALLDMGVKPVFKLTTKDGKTIRTTGNHPYLVVKQGEIDREEVAARRIRGLAEEYGLSAEDLSADREFSSKTAVWRDASLDVPMVGSMPAGDIVNKGYYDTYKSHNTSANNENRVHSLFTSIFGFRNSSQYNKHTETYQSRYAYPQRPFFEEITNKTCAKDYLRKICAHTRKSYSLFVTKKWPHSMIASLIKVYHKGVLCQDENLACADMAAPAAIQTISISTMTIPDLIRIKQSQEAEWTKVIYLLPGDLIAVSSLEPATLSLQRNVLWACVKSVEYVGMEQVYDISVEGTQNFFGNGVLAHNTYVSGNVGIGTTAPGALLDLGTAGTTAGVLRLAGVTSGNVSVGTAAAAGAWTLTLPTSGGTSGYLLSTNGSGITSWVTPGSIGASWSSLTAPSANLGLTMAGYTTTLTYNAATGAAANLFSLTDTASNTGTGYLMDLTTAASSVLNPLHIKATGTEALTVTSGGNVGIGTTAPVQQLHVVGQCVTGDTLLRRRKRKHNPDGTVADEWEDTRIDQIEEGDEILTLDEKTGKLVASRVNALMDMGVKPIYKITTESGKTIRTTGNHPYLAAPRRYSPDTNFLFDLFFNNLSKIARRFYFDVLVKQEIKVPAFGGELVNVSRAGWQHLVYENDRSRLNLISRLIALPKVVGVLISEEVEPTYSKRGNEEFWIFNGIVDDVLVKVVVRSINGGKKHFYSVIWQGERRKIFEAEKVLRNIAKKEGAVSRLYPRCRGMVTPQLQKEYTTFAHSLSSVFMPNFCDGSWTKVSELKVSDIIAATDSEGKQAKWEKITAIELLPAEQVYDIEVEGTHNFAANGIIAHNTYLSGNVGIGTTAPAQKLHVEGQCVTGDSMIAISEQEGHGSLVIKKKITDVKTGDYALSLDEETGATEPHKIKGLLDMGTKPVFELTTASGKRIKTTGNHPYFVKEGGVGDGERREISVRRIESMAGEHGFDRKDLSAEREFSNIRTIWNDKSVAAGGDIGAAEHRGGQGEIFEERIRAVPVQRAGVAVRSGNMPEAGGKDEVYRGENDTRNSGSGASNSSADQRSPEIFEGRWLKVIYLDIGDQVLIYDPKPMTNDPYVVWDKISSIKYIGYEQVYDIEVEGAHNFIANEILAHNTYISGNVGIGTTAPGALLDLGTAGTTAGVLRLAGITSGNVSVGTAATAGTWSLTLPTTAGTDGYVLKTNGSGVTSWISPGSIAASWSSLTVPSANLGLAMAGYTTTLTYNATTGAATNLFNLTDTASNTGTGYLMDITTAGSSALKPLHINAAGTEALTVLASGNVGIGSTAPVQKLHVEGQCVTGDTLLPVIRKQELGTWSLELGKGEIDEQRTTELREAGNLARGSESYNPNLSDNQKVSSGGEIWNNGSIAESNSFSGAEYSRRTGAGNKGGIPQISSDSVGIAQRSGDFIGDLSQIKNTSSGRREQITSSGINIDEKNQGSNNQAPSSKLQALIQYIPIADVKPGDYVLSLNEETGEVELHLIEVLIDMGIKPVFKLITETGKAIKTTGNHPYLAAKMERVDREEIAFQRIEEIANKRSGIDRKSLAGERNIFDGKVLWNLSSNIKDNQREINYQNDNSNNKKNGVIHTGLPLAQDYPDKDNKSDYSGDKIESQKRHNFLAPIFDSITAMIRNNTVTAMPIENVNNGALTTTPGTNMPTTNEANRIFAPSRKNSESVSKLSLSNIQQKSTIETAFCQEAWTKVIYLVPGDLIAVLNEVEGNKLEARSSKLEGCVIASTEGAKQSLSSSLQPLSSKSNVVLDKIVSIEYVGEEQVYDIAVEGTHNFVAGHWIEKKLEAGGLKLEAGSLKPEAGSLEREDRNFQPPASSLCFFGGIIVHNTYVSGNVGIGTTGPGGKLHIYSDTSSALGQVILQTSTTDTSTSGYQINFKDLSNIVGRIEGVQQSANNFYMAFSTWGGPSTNDLKERVRIDNQGNVGIGTTGPGAKLHVSGGNLVIDAVTGAYSEGIRVNVASNNYTGFHFGGTVGSTSGTNTGEWTMNRNPSGDFQLYENTVTSQGLYIKSGGNVGIGTTSPLARLGVVGADSENTSFAGNISGATGTGLVITNAGNVGIGTTGPSQKLDVAGYGIFTSGIVGDTANGFLQLYGDMNASTGIRLLTNGNVGIGTTGPGAKLDVYSAANANLPVRIYHDSSSADAQYYPSIELANTPVGQAYTNYVRLKRVQNPLGNYPDFAITTQRGVTDTTEYTRIYVDGYSGKVGIGTTSPLARLGVVGADSENTSFAGNISGATGTGLVITNAGNVGIGTTSPAQKLDVAGIITTSGSASSLMAMPRDGTGSNFEWYNPTGDDFRLFSGGDKVTITTTGNVGIGTTSPNYQLELSTDSAGKPTTNTWTIVSDKRVKKNITDFKDGLDVAMKLIPRTYQYNGLGGPGYNDTATHIGFVAQEIESVTPYMVETRHGTIGGKEVSDFKSYQGHALPFILVNAIKEQQSEIEELKQELAEIKKRLELVEKYEAVN